MENTDLSDNAGAHGSHILPLLKNKSAGHPASSLSSAKFSTWLAEAGLTGSVFPVAIKINIKGKLTTPISSVHDKSLLASCIST
jgi:hypothetical protein